MTAEDRRRQILGAARDCVRRSGFHRATMATIAGAACISVGQLYRYFENKEAIIAAIAAQDLADLGERFDQGGDTAEGATQALISEIPRAIARSHDPVRTALVLEVCAEAARNPKIGAIVQRIDAEARAACRGRLRHCRDLMWSDREFEARLEVLATLFEGMTVRAVANPHIDRQAVTIVVESLVRHLLRLA